MQTYLDTLGVHLVVLVRSCPVQTSVTLFANEQVGVVHLLEFKLDWLDELLCDELGRLRS